MDVKYSVVIFVAFIVSALPINAFAATISNNSNLETNGNITTSSTNMNNSDNHSKIKIVASFYPIYEFVKQIVGDRADISSIIPVGVEPHDYEPTIQEIQNAETANLIVYNGGGLEKWIDKIDSKSKFDASSGINFRNSGDNETAGGYDPHIWLDPILAKKQVENIRNVLVKTDPVNSDYYIQNANIFIRQLDNLNNRIETDFFNCSKKDFIAFHNAFSYFAKRYGLTQHSVHEGLTPEGEILPQRLTEVMRLTKDLQLNVIYSEDLVDPRSANVIAQEIQDGKVLILSPIEGIDEEEQKKGVGYIDKMNENIQNLMVGLQCPLK